MNEKSKKPWDKKIAIAIIHGAGEQKKNFADGMRKSIEKEFVKLVKDKKAKKYLEFKPICWADIVQDREDKLLKKMEGVIAPSSLSALPCLSKILWWCRDFIVSNFADVVAYQPSYTDTSTVYDKVHEKVAISLRELAEKAGGKAPLCIIGHSLGTIISTNYFYDISQDNISHPQFRLISDKVIKVMDESPSPLEQGKTLVLFYTLGCPIALWNLRFSTFDKPISVPAPGVVEFDQSVHGEWINFYEKHDPFSFPLSTVIDPNKQKIIDCEVKVGNFITHMTPFCHNDYLKNKQIAVCIAEGLARTWCSINGKTFESPQHKCSFSDKECNRSIA